MGRGGSDRVSESDNRYGEPSTPSVSPWDGLSLVYVRGTAAQRLKALGHPDRLRIVEVLSQHPLKVGEIAARAGLSFRTASRHMGILHAAGIVDRSRHGNHVLYALADREVSRLAAVAYRGAAAQARRLIAAAPEPLNEDLRRLGSEGS